MLSRGRWWFQLVTRGAACLAISASLSTAEAQNLSRLPLPPDEVRSVLAGGEQALAEAEYSDALERLQQVLDNDEDFFDPGSNVDSLKTRVNTLLAGLPAEGRAVYERLFGPTARALLDEAVAQRDRGKLAEVARRFFWTPAGRDAAIILADHLTDEGDVQGAGDLFDRLAQHPNVGPSLRTRLLLKSAFCWWVAGTEGTTKIRLAERAKLLSAGVAPLPGDNAPASPEDALDWLAESAVQPGDGAQSTSPNVTMFRGNSRRNGVTEAAAPVGDVDWQYPSVDEFDVRFPERARETASRIESLDKRYRDPDGPPRMLLPAGVPLIAGDYAVLRGYGALKAVFLETGEIAWASVHVDETFNYLTEDDWQPAEDWHTRNLDLFLAQRTWRDATSAALSCTDDLVLTIADGGMNSPLSQMAINMPDISSHQLAPHPYNMLMAYELRTGRCLWEAGGPPGPFDEPLNGVYFLGAPLPLMDRLYCLVEDRGQVRLVVINATTSDYRKIDIEWSQALYNPDVNLSTEIMSGDRRLAGLTPAISGNVIVCPTGESTVVAVDRLRRTLLWAHEYEKSSAASPQQQALQKRMILMARQNRAAGSQEEQLIEDLLAPDRWADSVPMIAGDLVILTPSDSDAVHCLRLSTGEEVWRRPRGDAWYAAGVHAGRLILVGRRQVEALRLSDGRPAWESSIPIPPPSGRGFRWESHYVLPLSTGEIATIDLDEGRIEARSALQEDAMPPGNLTAAGGRIVDQNSGGLRSWPPLDRTQDALERQIASGEDAAEALALRGELRLHLGREAEALDDLRQSNELEPNARVRMMIAETLIEGLRTDFPAYRDAADEIARLTEGQPQRTQFYRMFAEGLHRSGEIEAAYERYLQYAREYAEANQVERIDSSRLVRSDRWIRGRLEELAEQADGRQLDRLNSEIAATIESALDADNSQMLQRLLAVLPRGDMAQRVRQDVLRRSADRQSRIEAEADLLTLLDSENPSHQAYAAARLARAALDDGESGPWLDALTARLGGPLADHETIDGLTGGELLNQWRDHGKYGSLIDAPSVWPTAHVEVDKSRLVTSPPQFLVPRLGPPSEMLEGWRFFVDQSGANLSAVDQDGKSRWSHSLNTSRVNIRGNGGLGPIRYVSTAGRLVLVVTHDEFTVLDGLSQADSPTVLVNESLLPESANAFGRNVARFGNNPRRLRNQMFVMPFDGQTIAGNVAPLSINQLVFQVGNTLRAIDPYTGTALWTHEGIASDPGSEILADDDFVVVWPPRSSDVTIYRAADGERIGARGLPPEVLNPQPDGVWGRYLLLRATEDAEQGRQMRIGLYDPVHDETVWERSFVNAMEPAVVDGRDLCILQQDGTLSLLDGMTGIDRVSAALPEVANPVQIHVKADAERYFVSTFAAPENRLPGKRLTPIQQPPLPSVNGVVTAIDRQQGEVLWSRPVEYQQWQIDTPAGWPVLVFAAETYDPNPGEEGRPPGHRTTVLILDKQTGKSLFESDKDGRIQRRGWRALIDKSQLVVFHGPIAVSLTFSADPPEPEEKDNP
ncbi:MAG: hypothetical protein DWQ29_09240 [Planctomycetota bacterium]|nr:MAG: hypothetical protein DWQ29_09240 [Planctomycetota bacterium]